MQKCVAAVQKFETKIPSSVNNNAKISNKMSRSLPAVLL